MKYFKHDLDAFDDNKIWELIETQGMQGYGIWWWLLEKLYGHEEIGFSIHATETWFKKASKAMNLSDWRTLVRVLDTFSEVGLIDSQLWAEHHIYCPGIKKRASSYVSQKLANKERQRRCRKRQKQEKEQKGHTPVTRDNSNVTACHALVTANVDIDLDVDIEEEILSPEGDVSRVTPEKPKKRKDAVYYLRGCSEDYRQTFEDWWVWYKKSCASLGSSYGSKASAAEQWALMESDFDIAQFRAGCKEWLRSTRQKGLKAPHGGIFLKGKDTHREPYWVAALDSIEPQKGSDFMVAPQQEALTIAPELERELRAKSPLELTDEEYALLNPGFKIYGKGAV